MDLLTTLYAIQTKSNKEQPMIDFLTDYIINKFPEAIISVDDSGNIYVRKGKAETYPCVVAHTDTVFDYDYDMTVLSYENHLFGYNTKLHRPAGLGADDKNGIWVALKCLEKYDNIKVAFFPGEEIGCVGSNKANMTFFDDCKYVLQCDRRNNCDFITSICGTDLCGTNFIKAIPLADFGYKTTTGLSTDVWTLKKRGLKVACCNMSCGYYNPHTQDESTDFDDLTKCLNLVYWIIDNLTEVYNHNLPKPKPIKPVTPDYKKYQQAERKFEHYYHRYPTSDDDLDLDFFGYYDY